MSTGACSRRWPCRGTTLVLVNISGACSSTPENFRGDSKFKNEQRRKVVLVQIKSGKGNQDPIKVYAKVLSQSQNSREAEHLVTYIRNKNFRGWNCSCENFMFVQRPKNRNCAHIKKIRQTFGRFATNFLAWASVHTDGTIEL